ncbi:MAG: valine--tRNA ligase [Chitinophagales bacterium]|nr:valine--tRNA ligase [Chitinophagales bacterium]HMU97976.1 valine--tRNA ligase [Chitinophagales bacterium]HMY41541.1 valine--tRNA ligase [Chitinophagales bacterium]HMZ93329.1 valine--tRNA ligase [Chitinophagales bacterium]HNB38552.1 valine--tRNA ligase [Chitinophagales bacterium]
MELAKNIKPSEIEQKWYQHWQNKNYFHSEPDERVPYTIVIPPPNVTGVLHMGHMLNNTIQDVLIRKARMQGKNACWVPGTDHASIATESKVVAMLKEQGIEKKDLTRTEFLKHAWEWKEKYGGIILKQLEKLGASCDWQRTKFTMDESLSEAVIDIFIDLYNKGQIYRGVRMVNWDPKGKTAVSDEEVIHKEVNSKLYYIKYLIEENGQISDQYITVATTRPETIFGDTGVCVHPDDERYKHLKGKRAIVPIIKRSVPIIFDDYIDIEFGTGTLKVTPAHDINDYNLGIKHQLESIDILNDDGTLNEKAQFYIGEDRFAVRKKVAIELEEANLLEKVEDIKNKVGYSERTDAVIEPKLSLQWFLKMDKISKPALENVLNNNIQLTPEKFKNTYKHWMENVHDWCISRQLWWGHQIPAWHDTKGNFVVAKTQNEALEIYKNKFKELFNDQTQLTQDEDVLDTWFSSWLWPISVFDGFKNPEGKDINYYYPTNDLVTAPEILFFWVARMIIAGYEYRNEKPFSNVYLTGIVRDKQGRKMSKSLGNSPDPIDLIEKYGADGVRTGMLFSSPAGNDLPFDEKLCEQGRNFTNKIWNALRLIKNWEIDETSASKIDLTTAFEWFENKLAQTIKTTNELYSQYRLSEVLTTLYTFIWDDFCSWYLEYIKPSFGEKIDAKSYQKTVGYFEEILKLIHPFMPFITEEIYHLLDENRASDIIVAPYPNERNFDVNKIATGEKMKTFIANVRDVRNRNGLSPKQTLDVYVQTKDKVFYEVCNDILLKISNINPINYTDTNIENAITNLVDKDKVFIVTGIEINTDEEKEKLKKEILYYEGFITSIEKKLNNERFVQNAKPEIVEIERQKLKDGQTKLQAFKESLSKLG